MPGSVSVGEIIVIFLVALIVFGGRLPEAARSAGKIYRQFRKSLTDMQDQFSAMTNDALRETETPRPSESAPPAATSDASPPPGSPDASPPPRDASAPAPAPLSPAPAAGPDPEARP